MVIVTTWTAHDCKALRVAMGRLSQAEFAHKLGINVRTVKRWEAGQPISAAGQADLGTALANLSPPQTEVFRFARDPQDVQRRKLFHNTGEAAAPDPDPDQSAAAERLAHGAGRPDAQAVEIVRSTLYAAMQLDDQLGSPAATGLVTAQQHLTEAMLRDCDAALRPALLSLHAEWLGFAGALAWDVGDHATAANRYADAREAAHEAEDNDLAAYMLCHMSQLSIWQRRPRTAIDHAVAARSWVTDTDDRRLRAYVNIRMADAAALGGQPTVALRALEDAERDLAGLDLCHPSQSRAYFVGPGLLESYRGNVLANLGDSVAAAAASRRAVELMGSSYIRDRAMTMLEIATPLRQMDEIEEAAGVIGAAADLTRQNRSPRLAAAVVTARHGLAPWSGSSAVRDLDELLDARDIVNM
ncbi:helix-turn-helix domain-containing protein [Nocardia otitidiscaviarum]|uniref:helix-turn-helix domain-containing protein n=1 Tax=Nocardia otitidiscaviarum TaxID=1823 RepID=UPI0004A6B86A|nr:transcriptional regulator [Nocardia otitidiscaviarum]